MLTLTVGHQIFLTKEERYRIVNGETVQILGISVPVWLEDTKTSEPAIEVFVRYKIIPTEDITFIKCKKYGYDIEIQKTQDLPNEILETLTEEERDDWFKTNDSKPDVSFLKDIKDGGCAWLAFRQYNKLRKSKKTFGKAIQLAHFVEIKDIEALLTSIE